MSRAATKNLPVAYDEQLAAEAAEIAKRIASPSGDVIRITQDKVFKFPDGTETADPWNAVVLDFVSYNAYYTGHYDPSNRTPPACFALGLDPAALVPSDNAPDKQSDACAPCPMNQFGSEGKGKACKNHRLLALLPPNATEESPIWLLRVSPTGVRAWDSYVSRLANMAKTMPIRMITQIGFDPNSTYASVRFQPSQEPNSILPIAMARREEARARLLVEPDVTHAPSPRGKAAMRTVKR